MINAAALIRVNTVLHQLNNVAFTLFKQHVFSTNRQAINQHTADNDLLWREKEVQPVVTPEILTYTPVTKRASYFCGYNTL